MTETTPALQAPDPEWHQNISLIKSALRLGAGWQMLMYATGVINHGLLYAAILFMVSELFGVAEEFV